MGEIDISQRGTLTCQDLREVEQLARDLGIGEIERITGPSNVLPVSDAYAQVLERAVVAGHTAHRRELVLRRLEWQGGTRADPAARIITLGGWKGSAEMIQDYDAQRCIVNGEYVDVRLTGSEPIDQTVAETIVVALDGESNDAVRAMLPDFEISRIRYIGRPAGDLRELTLALHPQVGAHEGVGHSIVAVEGERDYRRSGWIVYVCIEGANVIPLWTATYVASGP